MANAGEQAAEKAAPAKEAEISAMEATATGSAEATKDEAAAQAQQATDEAAAAATTEAK